MDYWIIFMMIVLLLLSISNFLKLDRIRAELQEMKAMFDTHTIHETGRTDEASTPPPLTMTLDKTSQNLAPTSSDEDLSRHEPPPFFANRSESDSADKLDKESKQEKRSISFEKYIGGNLFSKIGILALVIGIGFFVKYAIDNDWINELGRTLLGLLTGFTIWGIAFKLRNKYRSFSSVLAGGAFAICFVTIAIAHQSYGLFSWSLALGLFVFLSAMMIFLSLRYDRRELAMIAIIGSYVSPFLITTGSHNVIMLFAYVALLSIAMFIITMRRHWWELSVAAILLTWAIVGMNISYGYTASVSPLATVSFSTLFFTLFSFPIAVELETEKKNGLMFFCLLIISVLNPLIYLVLSLKLVEATAPFIFMKGFFPIYVSAVNLLILLYFKRKDYHSVLASISLWIIVIFAAFFIPIQFGTLSVQSVAFSLYALILMVAFISTKGKLLLYASFCISLVTIATLLRLTFDYSSHYPSNAEFLCMGAAYTAISVLIDRNWDKISGVSNLICRNFYGLTLYLGCAFIFLSSIRFFDRLFDHMTSPAVIELVFMAEILAVSIFGRLSRYSSGFLPFAGLLFFTLNAVFPYPVDSAGIAIHWLAALVYASSLFIFAKRIFAIKTVSGKKGYTVYYSLTAAVFLIVCMMSALSNFNLSRYYSAGLSVALILSGTLLMLAGMYFKKVALRVEGLVFFTILLIKLVAYDIWKLPVLGRIIVFILLGAVLLCISFLYQKLKDKLFSGLKQ